MKERSGRDNECVREKVGKRERARAQNIMHEKHNACGRVEGGGGGGERERETQSHKSCN